MLAQKNNKQNKDCRICTKSWSSWIVLVQCNLVNNYYQQNSEVLNTFSPNKSLGYLLNVEPCNLMFLKTYTTKFDRITTTFTVQNGRSIEIKVKANLILLIKKQR